MSNRQRARSVEDEFLSCEGLEGQDGYLQQLSVSNASNRDHVSRVSVRTNLGDKTYWTRVFHPDEQLFDHPDSEQGKPGIFCINDDMEKNVQLVQDQEGDPNEMVEPIFEPKRFNELHTPLFCANYKMQQDELLEYAEMATAMKDRIAQAALELDKDFKRLNPNGPVTEKRLDTLVQKRFHPQTESKLLGLPKKSTDHMGIDQVQARKTIHVLSP